MYTFANFLTLVMNFFAEIGGGLKLVAQLSRQCVDFLPFPERVCKPNHMKQVSTAREIISNHKPIRRLKKTGSKGK
jgi:hypothetical protein